MKLQPQASHRHQMLGVTLIELLVVVAILAILGTIAVSTFRRQVLRANRTDATTTLLRVQVAQEKFFLQSNRYATAAELTPAPPAGLGITGPNTPGGYYTLVLASPTATTYTITATATGTQTADTACPTFSIDEQGARNPAASTGCWR